MRNPIKYFLFNKDSDFRRGSGENIGYLSPGIKAKNSKDRAYFFTRLLDSREKQMKWHRLVMDHNDNPEGSIKISLYASEARIVEYEGQCIDVSELLLNSEIPVFQKKQWLAPYLVQTLQDPQDELLFQVEGRYLWLCIELFSQTGSTPEIYRIKIYFPKNTWMEYLPEIYQVNQKSASFVERYLGIFQALYQDMTGQIETTPAMLDPDTVSTEILSWLSQWLCIDDSYVWTELQLRYLVKNAMHFYYLRGTTEYLELILGLYTGKKPYIVEYHQIEPFLETSCGELLQSLYTDNPYTFSIIVDMDTNLGRKESMVISKLVEKAKPAHMDSNIVVLEPYIFLNRHSYLGINSVLGQYQNMILDGQAAVSFTILS